MTFPFAWRRGGLALAWGGVAVSLALAPLLAGAPVWVLVAPWLLSAVALGLPHGAADPVVPLSMRGERWRVSPIAVFSVVYIALGAVVLAVWWMVPVVAATGFVVLTWAHWGQGDVYALRALGWDGHLASPAHRALAGVVRGGLPMVVPLAAHPEVYADIVAAMAAAFRPDQAEAARAFILSLPGDAVWGVLAAVGAAYAVWGVATASRRGAWRSLGLDLGEVVALAAFFALLPPLWSVGIYFCLWHAVRHLQRLGPIVADGSARRLALVATPATLGAIVLMVLIFGGTLTEPVGGVGAYLAGIAALTVPHVAVVTWMDARQRVWTAP
ncbi:MAG: Brp/Blh family beta-carotene 15,15'-dioxygenase [Bacteroidota bacterium]